MPEATSFDNAASAYKTILVTVEGLKVEYSQVCIQLAETQSALAAAPLLRVPLADLKEGILDFIGACGERYANEHISGAISNFARNINSGTGLDPELYNKPLRFCDLESAVNSGSKDYSTQLATPSKHMFDDRALYFLFAQLVKERVADLMSRMSPEEFGYGSIHSSQVGSDRATRRLDIEVLNVKLDELKARRNDLGEKLVTLGVAPADLRNLDLTASRSASNITSKR